MFRDRVFLSAELGNDGGAVRVDKGKVFAVAGKLEVGMQLGVGIAPVLARGKHQEEAVLGNLNCRETPHGKCIGCIGEEVSLKVDGLGAGVEDLYPVSCITILILDGFLVISHEFRDVEFCQGMRAG